jgi:hypothetical protein
MPSFDVVSEVNHHELSNAVDQANREVSTRFDFKGTGSRFELAAPLITMHTQSEFQLQQMYDILCNKLVKRGIDIACLEPGAPNLQLKTATQVVTVREGIGTDDAKSMVRHQGAGRHPGRPTARERQKARRPSSGDRTAEKRQLLGSPAIQELPRLSGSVPRCRKGRSRLWWCM